MSTRGMKFVEHWVSENINAEGYPPEGSKTQARSYAERCLNAANRQGVSKKDIEEETGDLVDYMDAAMKVANDAEVQRQVDKDKS
jgi:hypothetical protein